MNKYNIRKMHCPNCNHDGQINIWETIVSNQDPFLTSKLLNDDLYIWKCENCGKEMLAFHNTMYVDKEHKFLLYYHPWIKEYEDIALEIEMAYKKQYPGFTYRSIYQRFSLQEKIRIFKAELNDIAIERFKFFLKLDPYYNINPDDKIYFITTNTKPYKEDFDTWERGYIKFHVKRKKNDDSFDIIIRMEQYYDYLLSVKIDPRMVASDFDCVDEQWILTKLQNL